MTESRHSGLPELLTAHGFNEVPLHNPRASAVEQIWANEYSAIGLVSAATALEVVAVWADCQVQMAKVRKLKEIGVNRDLYLLFFIPEIETSSYVALQPITDDTQICRKICIETVGRPYAEAIFDAPLLTPGQGSLPKQRILSGHAGTRALPLSDKLLQDLATRSTSFIVSELLAGKYRRGQE